MKIPSLALQWATALSLLGAVAADPRVKLGYATYEGTSLNNGVDQFLGMRYAAPPLGENRFRRAKEPKRETHVIQAKEVRSNPHPLCSDMLTTPGNSTALFAMASRDLHSALSPFLCPRIASSSMSTLLLMRPTLNLADFR